VAVISLSIAAATVLSGAPANCQVDLTGEWANRYSEDAPHRGAGPALGDYTGLPLNDAARFKAEAWDASVLSTHERQCIPHVVTYALRGPSNFSIGKQVDEATGQLVAYTIHGSYGRPRTIWMDGRAHPPDYAAHTWAGFSTGQWEGHKLTVTTTHIKMGWIQRNGVPTSDLATMTEHFIRHGDDLTLIHIVDDPVYLTEPFIRTTNYVLSLNGQASFFGICGPAQIADEIAGKAKDYVPHFLPGTNTQLKEFPAAVGMPPDLARGGAETTYPEFMREMGRGPDGRSAGSEGAPPRVGNRVAPGQIADDGNVHTLRVQGNVYMLVGAGANAAVQIGPDGVLVVDTGLVDRSDKLLAATRALSDKPIRFVLNTTDDADHVGGNQKLADAGQRVSDNFSGTRADKGAAILAHERILDRMSAPTGKHSPLPVGAWPTDTYLGGLKDVFFNGEAVQLFHQPAAHADADSVVFFRKSDVVVAGDLLITTGYPVIDAGRGGTFTGVLDALNRIIDLTVPADWQEGGTMVIPGHGRLADEADLVEYRDMMTIVRDRIQALIKTGLTLEQVRAAGITRDYDVRYGATAGPWTTDMFVEAAFRDLSRQR
jgi:glyoxylase-like metal-dependent hydrolase (beta-lactamase superfamily II)